MAEQRQEKGFINTRLNVTETGYSPRSIHYAEILLYWLGCFSNISILLVFFNDGLSSSSRIGFFSLAFADLAVCVINLTRLILTLIHPILDRQYRILQLFEEATITYSAWTTAFICWERLCSIKFPIRTKRIITLRISTKTILGYLPIQVTAITVFIGIHVAQDSILSDPCSYVTEELVPHLTGYSQLVMIFTGQVQEYVLKVAIHVPNVFFYAMLVLGTTLFIFVFTRTVHGRGSPTTKHKQNNDVSLAQCVLALCLVHIFASGPRTVERMFNDFSIKLGQNKYYKYYVYASYILLAINHSINIAIYLVTNSKFREICCKICLLKFNRKIK